jgi:hypothetical protein
MPIKVGGVKIISEDRVIGSKTQARIILRDADSTTQDGELVVAYDPGSGKAKLRWFDGANTFVFTSD